MLDVTVCILSFNRAAYLREALASVLAQTKAPQDIAIFDNGSQGEVLEAVKGHLEKGVRWVGSEVTMSAIWNFKRAVADTKSKYVLVMHDDDRLCRDFLEKQIEFLEENHSVVAVACNGYLIDENGNRSGLTLRGNPAEAEAELYKCSAHVALKYAGDSCIPFSSVVYRTHSVRETDFREEFGKVCDAVFFCDMADRGTIAFQPKALYECRVHSGQDSSHFPSDLMDKLEQFLWTRRSDSAQDITTLHQLLIKQHTARRIRSIIRSLTETVSIRGFFSELQKCQNEMFSFSAALKLFFGVMRRPFR